jgi:diaphanous 1
MPGVLSSENPVAPLLNASAAPTSPKGRHFSAFPLTSHLHIPTLRLVSLHPLLSLAFTFLRIPEIHDGFQWKRYFSRSTTVEEFIDGVIEELGLTKSLPIPGAGTLQFVFEEVRITEDQECKRRPRYCSPLRLMEYTSVHKT